MSREIKIEKGIGPGTELPFNDSNPRNERMFRLADQENYETAELPGRADKSEALFSMYLERADEEDNKVTERWKKETDTILIFAGLFSAALAVLLAVSIQDLRPKPQDGSTFYLANIYHVLANSTTSQPVVLPTLADPPIFSPPGYAVWVNTLWSLSLVMSLTTAFLVIFLQQWAHSYLRATQKGHSSRTRTQIHTFYNKGLSRRHFATTVAAAPLLIHTSLVLFFAGLPVWLMNINHAVSWPVISWLGLCVFGYAYVTLLPIFHHDSPYYSPLSSLIWRFIVNVRNAVSQLTPLLVSSRRPRWSSSSLHTASLQFALALPPDFIYHSLSWTFESLKQDYEFEEFYDGIPNLCASDEGSLENFIKPNQLRLTEALIGLMDRTFSSSLVSEPVRLQRIMICTKTLRATEQHLLGRWFFLRRVLLGGWQGFLGSVSVGLLVQSWKDIDHPTTMLYAQFGVSAIIATALVHDDLWIQLVINHLAVSESTLKGYLDDGQSVLLANLNHLVLQITRLHIKSVGEENPILESLDVLESMCKFDVRRTLPELQHQFCDLWNQLVDKARNDMPPGTRVILTTLRNIYKVYIDLHEDTDTLPLASAAKYGRDSALKDIMSYPTCTIHGHHPLQYGSTFHISEIALPSVTLPSRTSDPFSPSIPTTQAIEAGSGTRNTGKRATTSAITAPVPFTPRITAPRANEAALDTVGYVSNLMATPVAAVPVLHPSPVSVADQAPDQAHPHVPHVDPLLQASTVDPLSQIIQTHLHAPDETHSRM